MPLSLPLYLPFFVSDILYNYIFNVLIIYNKCRISTVPVYAMLHNLLSAAYQLLNMLHMQ